MTVKGVIKTGRKGVGQAFRDMKRETNRSARWAEGGKWGRTLISKCFSKLESLHAFYFDTETGPDGPWEQLRPSTIARKGFDTILEETGELRDSLTKRRSKHSIRKAKIGPQSLTIEFGTSKPKMGYHMTGTGRMPARPFMPDADTMADAIVDLVADEVADYIRKFLKDRR